MLLMILRKKLRGYILPINSIFSIIGNMRFNTCLDVGAGTGLFIETFYKKKIINKGYGFEINHKYFKKINSDLEIGNNIPKEKFKLITMIDVLHHIDNKENFVHHYLSYTTKGSYILVKDMNPENIIYKYFNRVHDLIFSGQLVKEITPDNVIEIMRKNNIELVKKGSKRVFLYDHYFLLFRVS